MPFNVNDFMAQGLKLGGARPNQFEVNVYFPFQSSEANRLKFLCRASSIPPMVVDEAPAFYFGRAIKFAGDRTFPDWEVTIYNDEDFALRNLFEDWSNRMNALVSNRMNPNVWPTGYKVSGDVTQLGKDGDRLRTYSFVNLWPKIVDTMPLDWAAQNQIQEFNVTFAYDLWEPVSTDTINVPTYTGVLADDGDIF